MQNHCKVLLSIAALVVTFSIASINCRERERKRKFPRRTKQKTVRICLSCSIVRTRVVLEQNGLERM